MNSSPKSATEVAVGPQAGSSASAPLLCDVSGPRGVMAGLGAWRSEEAPDTSMSVTVTLSVSLGARGPGQRAPQLPVDTWGSPWQDPEGRRQSGWPVGGRQPGGPGDPHGVRR